MSKQILKQSLKQGILIGLGLNVLLPVLLGTIMFSGQCGVNFMGSGGRTCTYFDALVSPDGFLLFVYIWFTLLWWIALSVVLLSILGTYLYFRRKL
jgi:hypothetical protein